MDFIPSTLIFVRYLTAKQFHRRLEYKENLLGKPETVQ
jgi:hypothetical protein